MTEPKKFDCISASSKFAICGIPLRVDTYKTCSFGCAYCFSNNRKIMEFEKTLQIGNIAKLEKQLDRIFNRNEVRQNNFIDYLIQDKITWHCGGMSDPFQPVEEKHHITKQMIDLTNEYDISVLFSTKSDKLYDADLHPERHTFQLSISNIDNNKALEPRVPDIKNRYKLFHDLKDKGFRVGIRVQPFIPGITDSRIVEMFKDADYFTIEGIKLVPQNKEATQNILSSTGLTKAMFTQMGLLNLKPEIRMEYYKEFIEKLDSYNIPYSLADNDFHDISSGKCCCGDILVAKSTNFNNTAMCRKHGCHYTYNDLLDELGHYSTCKVNQLFTSNRQEGCVSCEDFYYKRFDRATSPFSPKFLYNNKEHD